MNRQAGHHRDAGHCTLASWREKLGFLFSAPAFLCGVFMFSLRMGGFSLGTLLSSNSPKTCLLGELISLNWPWVWMVGCNRLAIYPGCTLPLVPWQLGYARADPCGPNVDKAGTENGWMDGWNRGTFLLQDVLLFGLCACLQGNVAFQSFSGTHYHRSFKCHNLRSEPAPSTFCVRLNSDTLRMDCTVLHCYRTTLLPVFVSRL